MALALLSEKCREIQSLDRQQCIHELLTFEDIPLDFNREFLDDMSLERLRHVLLAAYATVMKYHRPAG